MRLLDRPAPPHAAPRVPAERWLTHPVPAARLLVVAGVILLTAFAFWVRVDGLQGWDGTLTVDETRLALAARGILETGLPRLPSGWVYTRGLLATYLTAPSFALLGESDFAARLPAVLAGTALIPVAYLLGRQAAGRLGGLFVAALLAGHPSFVVWSRQAWFYAVYVLAYAAALLFILRAHRTGRATDQLLAGALVGLTAFTHEVGAFLLLPLAIQVGFRLRQERRVSARWLPALGALALAALALIVLWLLVTRLRANSLVGAYGEIEEYLSPSAEWPRIWFYLRMLLDGPGLLLLAALIGAVLALAARRAETLLLWLALLPVFGHAAFLIPRGPQERYGLTLVLVIAVLAAQGVRLAGEAVARRAAWYPGAEALLAGALLTVLLAAHQDVDRAIQRAALSAHEGSWLRAVRAQGIGPADVVMTDVPTIVAWYVGGLDYWLVSRDYEKYTTVSDDLRRDVHTGAVVIRSRSELERLVAEPHAGEPVWVIASGRNYQWGELVNDDLKRSLNRAAVEQINPGDSARILLLHFPSGS